MTIRSHRNSLKKRVLITVGGLVGLLLVTAVSLNIWREYENWENRLYYRGDQLASFLTGALQIPIWNVDREVIQVTLDLASSDPDFLGVVVRDTTGMVLTLGEVELSDHQFQFNREIYFTRMESGESEKIGELSLFFSKQRLQQLLYSKLAEDLILLLLLLGLNLLGIYIGLRLITHPLDRLVDTMQSFSNGAYEKKVFGLEREDEIGVMAEALEILRYNSLEREKIRDQLKASNRTLELRVKQRTQALAQEVEERKEAERLARSADHSKSEFLANMSHEIRTPMNAIIGMSYLVLQTTLNKKQHNYINKVHRAAEGLLGIINEILDFSKIEAGQLRLEKSNFLFIDVITDFSTLMETLAREKGIEFSVVVDSEVPQQLSGDPLRLSQILNNLGSNAIKFTERGGRVEVAVSAEVGAETEEVRLHLVVKDTGIGMSQTQQEQIFSSFTQADASTSRKYGGTGLGLTITKRLIEMMDGEIQIESEEGAGSTFYVILTMGVAVEEILSVPPGVDSTHHKAEEKLRGAAILLVEDNEDNRELAVDLLTERGMEVTVAGNGKDALERLETDTFDGVLMDIQMPVMDGYEATRRIREQPHLAALPVLSFTSNVLLSDREKAEQAGINDQIGKPINVQKMLTTLSKWISPAHPAIDSGAVEDGGGTDAQQVDLLDRGAVESLLYNLRTHLDSNSFEAIGITEKLELLLSHTHCSQWMDAITRAVDDLDFTTASERLVELARQCEVEL